MVRENTNRIMAAIDEGVLDPKNLVGLLLSWLSEQEVAEFVSHYDLFDELDD